MRTLFLLFLSLSVSTATAEDLTGKFEASAFGGTTYVINRTGVHSSYGGRFGYGIHPSATVFGEISHTAGGGGSDILDVNFGWKQSLVSRGRIEPYVLGGGGFGHSKTGILDPVVSPFGKTHFALNAGLGTRVFVSNWWGVQPEFRWVHYFRPFEDRDILRVTGGLFVQWGR